MYPRANKVPIKINKLILKSIMKSGHIAIRLKTELTLNNLITSQNVQNLKGLT